MRVILEVLSGPLAKKRIKLAGHLKATIGRTTWADYPFPADTQMSGKHFSIECDGENCLVRDLDSTNGTYINDERVVEGPVASGSVVQAGNTKFRVTLEDVPVAAVTQRSTWEAADSKIVVTVPNIPLVFLPSQMGETDDSRPHDEALSDADPKVRQYAMLAAAWTGRKWVLEYCRRLSAPPLAENWEAMVMLAILGQASDVERILTIGRTSDLGSRRFEILGTFGHPLIVKDLLIGIESKNPAIAASAGSAFTKITGAEINSGESAVTGEPAGVSRRSSDDEAASEETQEEVLLPSPELANKFWKKHKARYSQGLRWCRGFDLTRGLTPEVLDGLDLESRWEACVRGRFERTWTISRLDREQLANRFSTSSEIPNPKS